MNDLAPAQMAHFTSFRSAREEVAMKATRDDLAEWEPVDPNSMIESDAVYFSRRAREELRAGINGSCRRAREAHFALAEAYEFRANLLAKELRRREAALECYAL